MPVRTAVGGDMWSKILGKTSVKKLVNKGGCFKEAGNVQQEANAISQAQ